MQVREDMVKNFCDPQHYSVASLRVSISEQDMGHTLQKEEKNM